MARKLKRSDSRGFTIIEVLIVLAIAALIMLIIFLAVPALNRSSHNTQRKNDAAAVAGSVENFLTDNGGTLPKSTKVSGTSVEVCAQSPCAGNTESATLGYYSPANISLQTNNTLPTADANKMVIVTGYTCNATNTGLGTANNRSAAIIYWTEVATGTPPTQCLEQ